MTFELAITLFGLAGTVCVIIFGFAAFRRSGKKEVQDDAKQDGTLLTEIGYRIGVGFLCSDYYYILVQV